MFELFSHFDQAEVALRHPAAADFYSLLEGLRAALRRKAVSWADYPTLVDYASICFWAIRKLEYSFAAQAFAAIDALAADTPLRILDVGCGVVPFCNWVSRRGHHVTAIDPRASDIAFLADNNLNAFYGSNVNYRVERSEQLSFADDTFDVVTCISVLEHIAPGNDRLSLWEMARVLKRDGVLIISFDVSPPPKQEPGQQAWPADRRRYAYPFAPLAAERLFENVARGFEVSATDVPDELRSLSWDSVYAFWKAAQEHDERAEPTREYLAMGGVLRRRDQRLPVQFVDVGAAYLEGQVALTERVDFYASHAQERMALVQQLDEVGQVLREEVEEKEQAIGELNSVAQERGQVIQTLHSVAAKRLELIEELAAEVTLRDRIAGPHDEPTRLPNVLEQALNDPVDPAAIAPLVDYWRDAGPESTSDATTDRRTPLDGPATIDDQRPPVDRVAIHALGEVGDSDAAPALIELVMRQSRMLDRIEARLDQATHSYEQARRDVEFEFQSRLDLAERLRVEADSAATARLVVIEEQQRALEHYRFWSWGERLHRFRSPKLGILYQYRPRPIDIPRRYLSLSSLPNNAPSLSIVTPSLNQGAFIERTIKSVIDQGYPHLEYIVQDAVSTDETPLILERYASLITHVESRPDTGFANGINMGFSHATGEIMAYLNSDDMLLPGTLHYVATYFASHPEVDVVYGHRVVVDEYDAEIGRWVLPRHEDEVLSWADFVPQETLFWRRDIWDKAGSTIDESFRFAIDWDLLIRFRDAGAKIHRLPRFLGAFRVHPHQKTSSSLQDLGTLEMNKLRQRAHGRPVSPTEISTALGRYLRIHIIYDKLYRMGILRY